MAYLEVQITDIKDYNTIKMHSDYSSNRTKVCSFSAQAVAYINAIHPDLLKKYLNKEESSIIAKGIPDVIARVENNKIYIDNGNIEILSFLDVRSLSNPELKIVNLWKLFELIKSGIVKTDETFDQIMKPISLEDNVSDLFAATGRMNFRGKLFSLSQLGEDFTLSDLKFDECPVIEKKFMTLKELEVQEFYPKSKTVSLIKDGNPTPYVAKFFYITPNMVSMLQKGRKITLATQKAYGKSNKSYQLMSPLILPRGYSMSQTVNLKCSGRYPSALYNAAYSEYLYRKEQ